MSKYIGFDVDSNKTVACVVQKDKKDRYSKSVERQMQYFPPSLDVDSNKTVACVVQKDKKDRYSKSVERQMQYFPPSPPHFLAKGPKAENTEEKKML